MKKIVYIKVLAMLLATLVPVFAFSGSITYTATFDAAYLSLGTKLQSGVTYTTVSYQGLRNTGNPGCPSLPVQYLKFSVPYNAANISVSASSIAGEIYDISNPILPCKANDGTVTMPDNTVYCSTNPYPATLAWVVDEGMLAGENHVVTVAVVPVTSVYSNGYLLNLMECINLTLNYELSETPSIFPLVRDGLALREKGFEQTRNLVINPQDVASNAVSAASNMLRGYDENLIPDETITDPATYLIVSTAEMYNPMRRIAALKRQKGIEVKLVSLDDVLNDPVASHGDSIPHGVYSYISYSDNAGKLRQYIRENYLHHGTEYVLLAGKGIPYRFSNGGQADMYFSDLIIDWLYGPCKYSTVKLGRLLGTKESQSENYADKLFRYELNPGKGNYSYLKQALVLESEPFEDVSSGLISSVSNLFSRVSFMHEQVDGGYPTGADVLDSISTYHYGFMSSFNNGTPSYIQLYGPDLENNSYYLWAQSEEKNIPTVTDTETGNGLDQMGNIDYPMVCLSLGGKTMSYDSYEIDNVEVSFGESFTMGKDYGGPVYMGLTGNNDNNVDNEMFAYSFGNNISTESTVLGNVYYYTKENYSNSQWENLVCRHNFLGDPALDMWTNIPQQYSNITISRTDNSVSLSGITAINTIIAYYANDGQMGADTISTSSVTLNNISPNSTIMLYKHDYIPYIAPLVLQNIILSNSQYVIASDVTAGCSVDSNRTSGNVVVSDGVKYDIETSGTVRLAGGFNVEKGGHFAVRPSSF